MMNLIKRGWSKKRKQWNEVEKVRKFTYLFYRISASGGCEAVVTTRKIHRLVTFKECSKILHGKSLPLEKIRTA